MSELAHEVRGSRTITAEDWEDRDVGGVGWGLHEAEHDRGRLRMATQRGQGVGGGMSKLSNLCFLREKIKYYFLQCYWLTNELPGIPEIFELTELCAMFNFRFGEGSRVFDPGSKKH